MNRRTTVLAFAVWLSLFAASGRLLAQQAAFNPNAAVRAAVAAFEQEHFTRVAVDDTLSKKWLQAFIDRLDPRKLYFLEKDLEEFRRFETRLDDQARLGDFEFPRTVLRKHRERTAEIESIAADLLAVRHDFSVEEEMPRTFHGYAASVDARRERWRLRLKSELLIEKVHGRSESEVKAQLLARYRRISRQAREMNDERLCQIYLDSLASLFDPHSGYLSPSYMVQFHQSVTPRSYTLGLGFRSSAGTLMISHVNPTFRAQLKGWILMAIRRIDGPTVDVMEMHLEDLGELIRSRSGELGTDDEVILELIHPVTLVRKTLSWPRTETVH